VGEECNNEVEIEEIESSRRIVGRVCGLGPRYKVTPNNHVSQHFTAKASSWVDDGIYEKAKKGDIVEHI
jgi:hypothetical protein